LQQPRRRKAKPKPVRNFDSSREIEQHEWDSRYSTRHIARTKKSPRAEVHPGLENDRGGRGQWRTDYLQGRREASKRTSRTVFVLEAKQYANATFPDRIPFHEGDSGSSSSKIKRQRPIASSRCANAKSRFDSVGGVVQTVGKGWLAQTAALLATTGFPPDRRRLIRFPVGSKPSRAWHLDVHQNEITGE